MGWFFQNITGILNLMWLGIPVYVPSLAYLYRILKLDNIALQALMYGLSEVKNMDAAAVEPLVILKYKKFTIFRRLMVAVKISGLGIVSLLLAFAVVAAMGVLDKPIFFYILIPGLGAAPVILLSPILFGFDRNIFNGKVEIESIDVDLFHDSYHNVLLENDYVGDTDDARYKIYRDDITVSAVGTFWLRVRDVPKNIYASRLVPSGIKRLIVYGVIAVAAGGCLWQLIYFDHYNDAVVPEALKIIAGISASVFGAAYFMPLIYKAPAVLSTDIKLMMLAFSVLMIGGLTRCDKTGRSMLIAGVWLYVVTSIQLLPLVEIVWQESTVFTTYQTARKAVDYLHLPGVSHWLMETLTPGAVNYVDTVLLVLQKHSLIALFGFSTVVWVRFAIRFTLDLLFSTEANYLYMHRLKPPALLALPQ